MIMKLEVNGINAGPKLSINNKMFVFLSVYFLPKSFYGEQISLALDGPFINDSNESDHQMTLTLLSGTTHTDVS